MSALEAELHAIIEAEGPISVERYMALCLQHPTHGYYTTRDAIGRSGDFITAPEISQMFGELIGLWTAQLWMSIGTPHVLRLVELGPGRGTLMADALRATRIVPGFHEAIWVDLVETSPRLEAEQRRALDKSARHIDWIRTIEEIPEGPAIVIANEFFDALPVRHYVRAERGWHERLVGLDDAGRFHFGAAREPIDIKAQSGQPGQILEVNHGALEAMGVLASRIASRGGAMLICDYGHTETGLGETLQAIRGHTFADVLSDPGEADLTAHIDFAALARAAGSAGADVHGPITQGQFLNRLGIGARADALKRNANPQQAATIDAALDRLTGAQSSMSTLFKAFAVTPKDAPVPPGFEENP